MKTNDMAKGDESQSPGLRHQIVAPCSARITWDPQHNDAGFASSIPHHTFMSVTGENISRRTFIALVLSSPL